MENQGQMSEGSEGGVTPELTVNDLNNIKQVLEAAVRRGAFQAGELSSVGAAYDKLSTFLQAIATQSKETQ